MEDLIRCSKPFISPTHHPHSITQCQVFINSQLPYKFSIAFPKQQSIKLPSLSTHHLKPPHCLQTPRQQITPSTLGITANEGDTIATHDVIAGVNAFHAKQSAINTDIQDKEALTTFNAQLPLDTDAPCRNEATPDISKMLVHSSDLNHANIQNAHAHNEFMHTQFEILKAQNEERILKRKNQQLTYLFAALASSGGIVSLAGASVYCRFAWQMEGGEVPWTEMFGTFSLALGAAVGMEYWARWAHRALWHSSLWNMHQSHHQPRDGPFELNDIFAIINAIPAILLMAFGFLHKGLVPGLCFGAGLGITVFGIAYMFVHDGLVHRRFPVGPIADVPYFQRVAAAHQLHHADMFTGVPYGLFLGPMELEDVGGRTELEKLLKKRKREKTNPING